MKTQINETESIDIPVGQLADCIYQNALYLRNNFEREDLINFGSDFSGTDCRLRWHNGSWQLLTGSADYDQDHRGYWACSSIPYDCTRAEAKEIAHDLIGSIE